MDGSQLNASHLFCTARIRWDDGRTLGIVTGQITDIHHVASTVIRWGGGTLRGDARTYVTIGDTEYRVDRFEILKTP